MGGHRATASPIASCAARPRASGARRASRSGTRTTSTPRSPRSRARRRQRALAARARARERRAARAAVQAADGGGARRCATPLAAYEQAKRVSSAFDFDDLLRYAVDRARVRRRPARRRRAPSPTSCVDEVQDLNPRPVPARRPDGRRTPQPDLLGDPDQAICAYRGATSEANFGALAADFPERTASASGATTARRRDPRAPPTAVDRR